jgi:methyl-accepting chemotaxis protein
MKLVENMNDVARRVVESTRDQATSSRSVLESAQAIGAITRQVATATAQQQLAGADVAAALERIRIAAGGAHHPHRNGKSTRRLEREAQ